MIDELLKDSIQKFIADNEDVDPFELSLKNQFVENIPIALISQQIAARKTAKKKFPNWYKTDRLVYPIKLSLEQSSSQQTAEYKASLLTGHNFADLTGGMGIDTWALSKSFNKGSYIEMQSGLADLARHNFDRLGVNTIEVINTTAEDFLKHSLHHFDLLYIDPARRDANKNKVFKLEDCTPNVVELLPILLEKSRYVLIKTSPMMDIELALKELSNVKEVHIVSVENDCKEVLYILSKEVPTTNVCVHTVNFTKTKIQKFKYQRDAELTSEVRFNEPLEYLYEPNSSIMKSGAYKTIAAYYNLNKLHPNTHLYTSRELVTDFPGRTFRIKSKLQYDRKSIRKVIPEGKANIATRNFITDVNNVKKKLGLKDGGEEYIFACRDLTNKPIILVCTKVSKTH